MDDAVHEALAGWGNFYLITGTAAAALTGLQFVVQTLIAAGPPRAAAGAHAEESTAAFGTPTVVHFALALVLSAVMAAPWPSFTALRTMLALLGAGALVYAAIVLRRTRRQRIYKPVLEDWVWHIVLPAAAYATVLAGAFLEGDGATAPLFAIAGATLLLVCIGIHNAWDTVTFLTLQAMRRSGGEHVPPRLAPPPARGRRRR